MIREIPITSRPPAYEYQITLDNEIFRLGFYFNRRKSIWFLNIRTQDSVDILTGLPLFVGLPLIAKFKNRALPKGEFLLVDTTGKNIDPTEDDFGDRVKFYYIEESEL